MWSSVQAAQKFKSNMMQDPVNVVGNVYRIGVRSAGKKSVIVLKFGKGFSLDLRSSISFLAMDCGAI